jgi:hypothetical protein
MNAATQIFGQHVCFLILTAIVCISSSCCNRGAIQCLIALDSKIVSMEVAIHLPPIETKGPSSWTFDSTARSQVVGMYRNGSTKNSSHCTCILDHTILCAPNSKSDHSELRHSRLPPGQDYQFKHLLQPDRRLSN